jgi:hypothetical protein
MAMESCREIRRRLSLLAETPPAGLPAAVREHLLTCTTCARVLAAARLARGLVASAAEGVEPPAGFAERVLAALPAVAKTGRPEADLWRPAWGLLPAFAAAAAALLLLFQASPAPLPAGLLPAESLTAGEQLVLDARPPEPEQMLAAMLEEDGR